MPAELTTGFLVAAPSLGDPNFERAVVLLTAHKAEGSLGFVVNRPAPMTFRDVVDELGLSDKPDIPDIPVLSGGPVAPETGWVLFDPCASETSDEDRDNVLTVSETIHISTSRDLLQDLAGRPDVERHMLLLGYAGWGAGQLDEEIEQGVWIPADIDERVIFDTPHEERWDAALATLGIDPMWIVQMPTERS